MMLPLLGRQEGDDRLQSIQAKSCAARQRQLATAQKKAIARFHIACAVPFDALDNDLQVIPLKVIGVLCDVV
jgi:hypothetical protein